MYKTTTKSNAKRHHHSHYDIYGDLAKIKDALSDVTYDMKGRAGEMLSQSLDDVKERSAAIQGNVSEYVADRPFKSIGLALLTGLLLGFFIRR